MVKLGRKRVYENAYARWKAWRNRDLEEYRRKRREYMVEYRAKQKSQSQNQDVTSGVRAHTSSCMHKIKGCEVSYHRLPKDYQKKVLV